MADSRGRQDFPLNFPEIRWFLDTSHLNHTFAGTDDGRCDRRAQQRSGVPEKRSFVKRTEKGMTSWDASKANNWASAATDRLQRQAGGQQ